MALRGREHVLGALMYWRIYRISFRRRSGTEVKTPRAMTSRSVRANPRARPARTKTRRKSAGNRQRGFTNSCVALAITREGSRCSVSAFANPRCSGMIALDEQAETTTIDLEVPVEGVAREALDALLSSDRSRPDSAALIFDSGPRVIAKTPHGDPQDSLARPSPVAPRIVRSERGLARRLAKEDRHLSGAPGPKTGLTVRIRFPGRFPPRFRSRWSRSWAWRAAIGRSRSSWRPPYRRRRPNMKP